MIFADFFADTQPAESLSNESNIYMQQSENIRTEDDLSSRNQYVIESPLYNPVTPPMLSSDSESSMMFFQWHHPTISTPLKITPVDSEQTTDHDEMNEIDEPTGQVPPLDENDALTDNDLRNVLNRRRNQQRRSLQNFERLSVRNRADRSIRIVIGNVDRYIGSFRHNPLHSAT